MKTRSRCVRWRGRNNRERSMRCKILGILLFLSIGFNVLTVSVSAVASAVSGLFEGVTGIASVLGVAGELLADAKSKQAKAETDLKASTTRNAQLNQELETSRTRLNQQNIELETARKKITTLDADLSTTKKRNGELLTEVAELRRSNLVTYRGNRRLIQHAVSDTSSRISSRTATGASRNIAATFGEAVPVAGTAIIVAATALELNDACVIMQDLHELDVAFNPEKAVGPEVKEVCGMRVPSADELWATVKASPGDVWDGAKAAIPDVPELDTSRLTDWIGSVRFPW